MIFEARRLKALEEGNAWLEKLADEAMLDNAVFKDVAKKGLNRTFFKS